MDNQHCLYKIKTNGLEYVGVSCNLKTRIKAHLIGTDQKGNTMRKYGYTLEKIIIDLSEEDAYQLEELIVDEQYIKQSHVLNSTTGGVGSWKHVNDAYKNGTLTHAGMTDECLKGRALWNKTPEGIKRNKEQGKWLSENHGKAVFEREGHQSKSSMKRWEGMSDEERKIEMARSTGIAKGENFSEEEKAKRYPKATCPKCGQTGNARAMKQWHGLDGSKCKKQ